jgi:hypothetical protein
MMPFQGSPVQPPAGLGQRKARMPFAEDATTKWWPVLNDDPRQRRASGGVSSFFALLNLTLISCIQVGRVGSA